MKPCPYCGRENDDPAVRCIGCGSGFVVSTDIETDAALGRAAGNAPLPTRLIDARIMDGAFDVEDGFTRVDWPVIANAIERAFPAGDHAEAWTEAARYWVWRLREDLGGRYEVEESPDFILLADAGRDFAGRLVRFAGENVAAIRHHLDELAWHDLPGKQVVMLLSDEDDYYQYLSQFCDRDTIPGSLGFHVERGLPHIVVKLTTELEAAQTLAHELTHSCLVHLPIPLWLNEGIAMRLQRVTAGAFAPRSHEGATSSLWAAMINWVPPLMWDELAERQYAFWNERNIQSFWAGTSFSDFQESVDLSYNLAEVLVTLLGENREEFLQFVGRAHYDDAGQTAALDSLGLSLGDAAATFLGDGNWRPVRKALVECWTSANAPLNAGNPP